MHTTSGGSSRTAVTLVLDRSADSLASRAESWTLTGPAHASARRRPLVLAHRGTAGPYRRENTVRAVEAALHNGADGVEVDVRLSGDGVLVCSHDALIPTASGPDLVVAAASAGQLRGAAADAETRLATVHEVIAAVARHQRDRFHRRARLVVEAKPAQDRAATLRTVTALHAALDVARLAGVDVTVSSFDPVLLDMVRGGLSVSQVRTALLGGYAEPVHSVLHRAASAEHDEAHVNVAALRHAPHAIALARHVGVSVTVWTVNSRDDLQRFARWGVDAVITDNVVGARLVLAESDARGSADRTEAAC